jgi:phasin family protein
MSETTKTVETTRKVSDNAGRAGSATVEAIVKATRDTADETNKAAQNGAFHARQAVHSVNDAVAGTADTVTAISSKVAEQGRDAVLFAARTAADVGSRVAEISFGRSHHLLTSTAQALDVYRDASERSAEHVNALLSSYFTLGRGLQQIQHAWLEIIDHSLENAAHKPRDLLRAKNLVELAELQRDVYLDTINHAVASGSRLLELASRTAQEAVRPLQTPHH